MTALNLSGERFGRLVAKHRGPNSRSKVQWWCECDCEEWALVATDSLRSGKTQSCGCIKREQLLIRNDFRELIVEENTVGCHIVTSHTSLAGYGYPRITRNGKTHYVHRYVWQMWEGPIPEELCVLHKCDTPLCANIEHLFLGTRADNMYDCIDKGRHTRAAPGARRC